MPSPALNLHQEAKQTVLEDQEEADEGAESVRNTALIDGVRRFMDVQDLDIDLIDRINPFGAAYAILAKAMNEGSLRQVHAAITAKKVRISPDEARDLARRALRFKKERGRLPSITSADPWEKAHGRRRRRAAADEPGGGGCLRGSPSRTRPSWTHLAL